MNDQLKTTGQYRQVQVETSTTLDLLRLAYTGIVDNLNQALEALEGEQKSYDAFNEKLSKAQQIVSALDDGLDESQGELAEMLSNFYQFIRRRLIESNMEKSTDEVKEVIEIVEQVRNYWNASSDELQLEPSEVTPATRVDISG